MHTILASASDVQVTSFALHLLHGRGREHVPGRFHLDGETLLHVRATMVSLSRLSLNPTHTPPKLFLLSIHRR